MNKLSEKDLDRALEKAFSQNAAFVEWFLNQTKFAGQGAAYNWSRSNHPFGKATVEVKNAGTGEREAVVREGETDVLVVFKTQDNRLVAVHIENKLSTGKFTSFQPALYAARAEGWKGNPRYGGYEDWATVLVAPRVFRERFPQGAAEFNAFIAHEDIADFIPAFACQS